MRLFLVIALVSLSVISCNKEKVFGTQDFFTYNFESDVSANDLIGESELDWQATQITKESNGLYIDTIVVHNGLKSLRCEAAKSDDEASKCSVFHNDMAFYSGSTIEISAWYYLVSGGSKDYLFLMDLEEKVSIGAGPGIRVALDPDGALFLERKKYAEDDIYQNSGQKIIFPFDQWVEVKMQVELSQKDEGRITLYQNGDILMDARDVKTLPTDKLYLIQGSAGLYSNIEFGITANTQESATILYVDDIEAKTIN